MITSLDGSLNYVLLRGFKSHVGSCVRQETSEESRRTYRPKRCEYNSQDEDKSLKTLNDEKLLLLSLLYSL